jgi:hypothetical protein
VLTGAQVKGSVIPEAVSAEGIVPEAKVITEAVTEPAETAAPGGTEEVCDDALPEMSLDVVVRSPEIQDAEPIVRRRCPSPQRLVATGSNFSQMTLSTQQR